MASTSPVFVVDSMLVAMHAAARLRFVAQVLKGVSKPVGGQSRGTIRVASSKRSSDVP